MYEPYKKHISELQVSDKYRRLPNTRQGNRIGYVDFSQNDYLALSQNSQIIKNAVAAAKKYGIGSTGSRLLSGNTSLHEKLEKQIAIDKHTEAGLVFSSGFQANLSTLSAILDQTVLGTKPIVFFDKLNHSSLYHGVFLSNSELVRYTHNDLDHLEAFLCKYKSDNRPKFIITETIFGMDGDVVCIEKLISLSKQYKAFLYLDEAHATGVFGLKGYGLSSFHDLSTIPHIIMGTFSKALGCSGGYIACSAVIKDYLINRASGFIYSTSPSPIIISAVLKAWQIIEKLDLERQNLQYLGQIVRNRLSTLGLNTGNSSTHIVPIILGSENYCLEIQKKLFENKILVSAIRPPSVPLKSSRLRIAITAKHTIQDIEILLETLNKVI